MGKTISAHTPLFPLPIPLTRVRVGEVDNAHTPVCQASYLLVPHATRDGHRAPAVAMVQTLVHVRLTAVAMSLNYGWHGCSTAVAMYGLVYYRCHDFKTLEVATY